MNQLSDDTLMNQPLRDLTEFNVDTGTDGSVTLGTPDKEHHIARNGCYAALLGSWGVIEISGPDASKFLQGQTTADFRELSETKSIPACYLNLKGRVLASFRAIQDGESVLLVLPSSMVASLTGWFAKFIVFSKATIRNASSDWIVLGAQGKALSQLESPLPEEAPLNTAALVGGCRYVSLGDGRQLVLMPAATALTRWNALEADIPRMGDAGWLYQEIASGFATITPETSDLFLPQMLHYQLFDGLSFAKGCYAGQEVVARAWFRGKIKQHMRRFHSDSAVLPSRGSALTVEVAGERARIGDVVMAAPDEGGCTLLAVVREDYMDHGPIRLDLPDSPSVREESLPYAIPIGNNEGA